MSSDQLVRAVIVPDGCPFAPGAPRTAVAAQSGPWQFHVGVLLACVVVLLLSAMLRVQGQTQVALPLVSAPLPELCSWRRYFGVDCPGCGLTRSFICLAHGDVARAWGYNPAGLMLFTGMLFQFPYRGMQLARRARGLADRPAPTRLWIVWTVLLVVTLLGQWAWRMAGNGLSIAGW